MAIAKRVILFLITNMVIVATISIIMRVFGLDATMTSSSGINHVSMLVMCTLWGMGASIISLLLSKVMVKRSMGVQVIDENTGDPRLLELRNTVHSLALKAGLPKMPEVGYYNSPEVNAFATGPTKSNSLVAVSSGLLSKMRKDEVEGVLGHEVAHIANGDMVTMTLLQGVINAFVMYLARVVAFAISNISRGEGSRDNGTSGFAYFGIVMVFQFVFGIFGSMIVGSFSRWREFRADKGGAELAGRQKMIAALERLNQSKEMIAAGASSVATMKISGKSAIMALMSTHPPLEKRIAALREGQLN